MKVVRSGVVRDHESCQINSDERLLVLELCMIMNCWISDNAAREIRRINRDLCSR